MLIKEKMTIYSSRLQFNLKETPTSFAHSCAHYWLKIMHCKEWNSMYSSHKTIPTLHTHNNPSTSHQN